MDSKGEATPVLPSETEYAQVPLDFPRPVHHGTVSGAQPKLLMTQYQGRFYIPGCTPPEVFQRWDVCEDLAKQLSAKSIESKAGKRRHLSDVEILNQYLPRLIATRWTTEEEARWTIRRTAAILGWPVPAAAQKPVTFDAPPKTGE
jgi:hypothetical protein